MLSRRVRKAKVSGYVDPYAGYLLYDTFTDANGTNLTAHTPDKGLTYTADAGAIGVQSNQAQASANCVYRNGTTVSADGTYIWSATIGASAWTTGMIFRASDANNWILCQQTDAGGARLQAWKFESGWTQLADVGGLGNNGTFELKVITSGTSIDCYENDTPEISVTSAFNQTATGMGMRIFDTNSTIDNFTAT